MEKEELKDAIYSAILDGCYTTDEIKKKVTADSFDFANALDEMLCERSILECGNEFHARELKVDSDGRQNYLFAIVINGKITDTFCCGWFTLEEAQMFRYGFNIGIQAYRKSAKSAVYCQSVDGSYLKQYTTDGYVPFVINPK